PRELEVLGVQVDADVVAAVLEGDLAGCAAAVERVEHRVAGAGGCENAGADEVGRVRSEVRLGVRTGRYGPHASLVAGVFDGDAFRLEESRAGPPVLAHVRVLPAVVPDRLPRVYGGFGDRLGVVEVPLALGEQEQVLVRLRGAVPHALGHRVGLVPDDVRAEVPAVGLQREGVALVDDD